MRRDERIGRVCVTQLCVVQVLVGCVPQDMKCPTPGTDTVWVPPAAANSAWTAVLVVAPCPAYPSMSAIWKRSSKLTRTSASDFSMTSDCGTGSALQDTRPWARLRDTNDVCTTGARVERPARCAIMVSGGSRVESLYSNTLTAHTELNSTNYAL